MNKIIKALALLLTASVLVFGEIVIVEQDMLDEEGYCYTQTWISLYIKDK